MSTYKYKTSDPFYHTRAWKKVRRDVLSRDHGRCVQCLAAFRRGDIVKPCDASVVHHIKPLETHPELGLVMDNLQSLCESCHNKVHPEKGGRGGAGDPPTTLTHGVRIIKV